MNYPSETNAIKRVLRAEKVSGTDSNVTMTDGQRGNSQCYVADSKMEK